jgi:hypothetical protein
MPKFAVIKDEEVENIIIAENIDIAQIVSPNRIVKDLTLESPYVGIGWDYKNNEFTPKPKLEEETVIEPT